MKTLKKNAEREYFWENEYPFGEFLKSIFGNSYQRKYSMIGDGIYNLLLIDGNIYSLSLKEVRALAADDNKLAYHDSTKDQIIQLLKQNLPHSTSTQGKYVFFPLDKWKCKIEIVKKKTMPQ